MKLIVDFHHAALAESMLMLFQDRYNVDVFFPAGMEWFNSDIWQFEKPWYGNTFAIKYLVDMWNDAIESDGILIKKDIRYPNRIIKGIRLDTARQIGIDFIISTVPHNDIGFHMFANEVNARFGIQVGNAGQKSRWDLASFIMLSSTVPGYEDSNQWGKQFIWNGKSAIIYHQEFDAKNIFYHDTKSAIASNIVSSFVTRMPQHSPIDYNVFRDVASDNKDNFSWRAYGSYGPVRLDEFAFGDIIQATDIANEMRASRIGIHIKSLSDGFGHAIHNWAAVGRPILWVRQFYNGTLANALWQDGVTAWSLESMPKHEVKSVLERLRDDDDFWMEASLKARNRFDNLISFDDESKEIANMLGMG